jgi:6-phosphogluconolactonase
MLRRHLLGAIVLVLTAGALDARAQQRTFAYAPSSADDAIGVWQLEEGGTSLRAAGTVRHPIGTRAPLEVVLQPSGLHAYVVHAPSEGQNAAISLHRIDSRTGRLEFRSLLLEATGPLALALDAAGRHAYVVDAVDATLRTFSLDSALGSWRERHAPMPTGTGPCQVLLDPRGTFLFVLNRESCSISRYRLDTFGRPELAGEDVLLNGSRPVRALMDPSGERLYVSVETYDVLLSMSIDARDGALRTINAAGTGSAPSGLTLNESGERIFVAERGSDSLSAFDIDPATGQLGARLGPFPTGPAPTHVALAADNRTIWITGGASDLRSFVVDGQTTAAPGVTQRSSGPLGPLVGLAREVTCSVAHVTLVLREDGTLSTRPEARGKGAIPASAPSGGAERAQEQVVGSVEARDELVIDPFGTWVLALGRRPGRFELLNVDPNGRFVPAGAAVEVGPEVAAAAVAPCGSLVAIATRTPASVHTYSLLGGAPEHLHSLPLSAAPDALAFDTTGRALFVAHTTADRLTAIALDEAGFMLRSNSIALAGGPGPLALAPTGDVLFVGLQGTPGVVPCDIGARPHELVIRSGLGVELPQPPKRLEFAPSGAALLAALAPGDRPVRIDRHPATGALSLRAGPVEPRATVGTLAVSATPSPTERSTQSSTILLEGQVTGPSRAAVRATASIELALPAPRASEPRGRGLERPPTPGAKVAADSERARSPRD